MLPQDPRQIKKRIDRALGLLSPRNKLAKHIARGSAVRHTVHRPLTYPCLVSMVLTFKQRGELDLVSGLNTDVMIGEIHTVGRPAIPVVECVRESSRWID
jgi:hypothetical protein